MQVMLEIKKHGLHVYELPPCDEDEDESFKAKDKQMKASIDEFCSVLVRYSCNYRTAWNADTV